MTKTFLSRSTLLFLPLFISTLFFFSSCSKNQNESDEKEKNEANEVSITGKWHNSKQIDNGKTYFNSTFWEFKSDNSYKVTYTDTEAELNGSYIFDRKKMTISLIDNSSNLKFQIISLTNKSLEIKTLFENGISLTYFMDKM